MRLKTMLVLFALFGVLSANRAFAKEMEVGLVLEWRVTEIRYEDGEMHDTLPNTRISAVFSKDGEVTGSAGCNRYFAAYNVTDKNIKIGPAATTKMFCALPQGTMKQESAFLRALESAARFRFKDGQLELLDLEDRVAVVLVDMNSEIFRQSLTGTWHVENLGSMKLLPGTRITMTFTEDGKVAGKATINSYFASWVESDGLILFSHPGSTMMAGPEPQMKQESEFFRMLDRVRKYKIREGQLILTTAEGEEIKATKAEQNRLM